jgi:sensor histidine kinase YesM
LFVAPSLVNWNDCVTLPFMKTLLQNWKARWNERYRAYEVRKLAELPCETRDEIERFNVWWKANSRRAYIISALVWAAASIALRLSNGKLGWIESFVVTGVVLFGLAIGLSSAWFGHAKFKVTAVRMGMIVLITVGGGIVGVLFGGALSGGMEKAVRQATESLPTVGVVSLSIGIVYVAAIAWIVQYRRKSLEEHNALLAREANAQRLARQLADARLKLMQAQVEPHFLFNTLASVQQLAEGKAPEAARLTSDVITFLRAGLMGLREETSTLAREFEMADAYLNIMKVRMDKRLSASVVLPHDLARHAMPPAMLISLVENAIKHGVEPAVSGGAVEVTARVEGDELIVSVADTGMGLGSSTVSGDSVGLSNIRERLAAIYGERARLVVGMNTPRGTIAEIVLPVATSEKQE